MLNILKTASVLFIYAVTISAESTVVLSTEYQVSHYSGNTGIQQDTVGRKQDNGRVFRNDNVVEINKSPPTMQAAQSIGSKKVYDETSVTKQYDISSDFYDLNSPHSATEGVEVYEEHSPSNLQSLESGRKGKEELQTDPPNSETNDEINPSSNKSETSDALAGSVIMKGLNNKDASISVLQSSESGIEGTSMVSLLQTTLENEGHTVQGSDIKKIVNLQEQLGMKTTANPSEIQVQDKIVSYTTVGTEKSPSLQSIILDNDYFTEVLSFTDNTNSEHQSLDTVQFENKSSLIQTFVSEHNEYDDYESSVAISTDTTSETPNTSNQDRDRYFRFNSSFSETTFSHIQHLDIHPTTTLPDVTQSEDRMELIESSDSNFMGNPIAQRLFGEDRYNNDQNLSSPKNLDSLAFFDVGTPQPLRDFEDKSVEDKAALDSLLKEDPGFKKEKIEPGVLFEDCLDCDIRILPIKPLEQRSTSQIEEALPTSKIRFADLPEGRDLQINSLGLSDGIFVFSYISEFLSWIQPNDFPVELLREALKNQLSWISLITQSLQVEAGFVVCLVIVVLLALAVPVVVLSHACYRLGGRSEDDADSSDGWAGNCRRRTLVFILQILLVLLCGGMLAMFVTNEQLSTAIMDSGNVIQTSLSDVSSYVHNTHLQLHFLLTNSLDQTLQAMYADLDNVDTLLGRPIQRELIRETGLDVALDSLGDLTREAKSTTQQVERFLEEARVAQEMLISAREKMTDLRQQVELFRRACGPRDRALCDTIDASGLEVTLRLDRVKSDERLTRMKRMGGVGLELAAKEAREHFLSVPARVETNTRDTREETRRQLVRLRAEVDDQTVGLERLSRDMTTRVNDVRYDAGSWLRDLDQVEYWRWIVCLGGAAAVLLIWTMLLCSMCCGCCGSEKAAGPTILVTIVLVCLFSTILWLLVLIGLLVGGHSEVFLCRPLHDEPDFQVLSRLVDQPGVFYTEPTGGFIANVIYGNDTIDVPIKQLLQECRDNRPAYPALGLNRVLDLEAAVSSGRWSSVTSRLRGVKANLSSLEVLSPELTNQLADLLNTLNVNFTEHRIQMSKPVTGKDLDSFARQLDNIGNQLRDLATASRMETLSSRTRRVIDTYIRPLESKKDALVYQLTALEVQTQPLQRQVNQSLSHLKTIQFFINSQGDTIGQRKSREYVDRLMSYVDQLRHHVTSSARDRVAPCKPLWDVFNNDRLFLCRHTVDPLNGYWFATMWCLLVLLAATPVCLKLVDYYRAQGIRSSGSPSDNLMISEQGAGWSSPGSRTNTQPANDNW